MKKEYSSSASWNSAALAGVILAAVTIAMDLVSNLAARAGGFGGSLLTFIAWAAKIALCVYIFRFLLIRFYDGFDEVDYERLKGYGMKLALFSSILVTGFSAVQMILLNPDTVSEAMAAAQQSYASMMDSNSQALLEKMMPKMPLYTSIFSLIYCFIWGWTLSIAFSKKIAPYDPFANFKDTDNQ